MMNRYNLISIFALILIFTSGLLAQTIEPNMTFEKERHNFGKIKEDGGKVSFKFVFTNMGSDPILINDVKTSCGCTTPNWSRKPILPGSKSEIEVIYNPDHRPGAFNKTITIKSNAKNSPVTLHITGEVSPKKKDIADDYRYTLGQLRMKKRNINFRDIFNTEIRKDYIDIINTGTESVTIGFNEQRRMPAHIKMECKPSTLKPNQKAVISIVYDAGKKKDWGYVYDRIYVNLNGKTEHKNTINISATIIEKFSQEMIDNPPVFTMINDMTHDFGTIKQGDVTEHVFKFKNTGKHDLIIRKTKASCGCTVVNLGDKIIKPGQESSIKAIFNSRGKRGNQHKTITVTTNIPNVEGQSNRSVITLMMKGVVEVPPKETKTNLNKNTDKK